MLDVCFSITAQQIELRREVSGFEHSLTQDVFLLASTYFVHNFIVTVIVYCHKVIILLFIY